ncbi:The_GLUG motif protein [Hexamita inflata]|uniref:The GLUG motif protein n=1 Tax=Hexamita inflata TaxID=28002 RepID=A0AA86TTA8_9EUKA|nr:The GLUG motif protein [Hexamita inflata]
MYQNINQYIQENVSVLDQRIADNITVQNQKIYSENNKLLQIIITNSSVLESRIVSNASAIYQRIADNITILNNKLSQAIVSNFTMLDKRIKDNITAINQSILSGNNILLQNIIDNSTRLDQRIFLNISSLNALIANTTSKLTQNILDNTTNMDKRIFENITNVYSVISSGNSKLLQNIVANSTTLDSRIFNNITSLNQNFTQNITAINTLIQKLQGQIDLLQNKQDKLPLEMLDNMFQQENYEATELWMVCGQPVFVQTFDITSISNPITALNFTNGSVFGSLINVQSAFIDIQGGVYASVVQPLFAAQNQFYNIKVQVGTQIVGSGQILSNNNAIIINQFTILSKVGTIITINSLLQLNILQTQSINTNVKDMKVNLDVEASTGNLGLVGSLTGQMNIINYQLSGTYETQGSMSLGALTLSSSSVMIKHLNFMPQAYVYGNQSSYLFRIVSSSSVEISRSTFIIGNQSTQLVLGSLTTTSTKYQQFGGFVSQMTATRLIVAEISYTSNFTCTTLFMTKSGLLLGMSITASSQVIIQGICTQSSIAANTTFNSFGLIGYIEGNVTVKQANIVTNISAVTVNYLGVIGNIPSSCKKSSFSDLVLQQQTQHTSGGSNSALVGYLYAQTSTLAKIQLNNSLQNGTGVYGGFLALSKSDVSIKDSLVNNSIIVSTGYSGTITGQSTVNQAVQNIIITNCFINSSQYDGGVVGYADSDISIHNGAVMNCTFISGQNLASYIGIVQSGHQVSTLNANSSDMLIISLTSCSAATIIGLSNANNSVTSSYTKNINISNINGGLGSGSIIGYVVINATIVDCHSESLYINSTTTGTGGIVGWSNISILADCSVSNAQIIATSPIGGISGIQNNMSKIMNCQVINISINSTLQGGGIAGAQNNYSEILHCFVLNASINSTQQGGGIAGIQNHISVMSNCYVLNSFINGTNQSGGISGLQRNNSTIISCKSENNTIVSTYYAGGIVANSSIFTYIQNSSSLNCSVTSTGSVAGGIFGVSSSVVMDSCTVNYLSTVSGAQSGGITGNTASTGSIQIQNVSVSNTFLHCLNGNSVGSIIGISNINSIIHGANIKNITILTTGATGAGGVVGYSLANMQMMNCIVDNLNINSTASGSGGIIGYSNISSIVNCSVTNSYINSTSSAGGIMGYQIANTTVVDSQTTLQNTSVRNTSVSSSGGYTGGLVGYYASSIHDLYIKASTVSSVSITSKASAGIVAGKSLLSSYSVSTSGSEGVNSINNVVQANCDSFVFTANAKGC